MTPWFAISFINCVVWTTPVVLSRCSCCDLLGVEILHLELDSIGQVQDMPD